MYLIHTFQRILIFRKYHSLSSLKFLLHEIFTKLFLVILKILVLNHAIYNIYIYSELAQFIYIYVISTDKNLASIIDNRCIIYVIESL